MLKMEVGLRLGARCALFASSVPRLNLDRFGAVARILSGALAGALLLLTVLAANGKFHQALHLKGKSASDNCVLCLFAKGQVDLPQSIAEAPATAPPLFTLRVRLESIVLVDFTYLSSPSRAPPALAPSSTVMA